MKRLLDLSVASILLVLLSPVLVVLGLLIRLDSRGPVLFRQVRVGHGGVAFLMWKFRTMDADADDSVHRTHYQRLARHHSDDPIRLDADDRITSVGRFMRRWSLDELPNLWNVLVGDMSLVGPRPLVPYEVELLDDYARRRLEVKPGMTGLAQINGRSDVSFRNRANLDVEYVEQQSLLLDLGVLARTLPSMVRNPGD